MATKPYKGIAKSSTKASAAKRKAQKREAAASEKYKKKKVDKITSTSARKKTTRKAAPARGVRLMPLMENLVPQPPESPLTRKGISLKGILRNTPRLMHANAEEVSIGQFKKTKTKSGLTAFTAVCVHHDPFMPNKTIKKRNVYIIGLEDPKKPVSKQRRVMCSCNCENFAFTWEYALAVHGGAKVLYGNGEPPIWTNPALVPGMCKHIAAVAKKLIAEGK